MANTRTACSRAFSQKILHPKSQCSAWRQEMEPKGMINTKLSNSKNKLIRSKLLATFFIVPCCVDSPLWTISLCQQVVSGASATVSSNGPRQLGTKTQIQMLSSTYSATRLLICQIEIDLWKIDSTQDNSKKWNKLTRQAQLQDSGYRGGKGDQVLPTRSPIYCLSSLELYFCCKIELWALVMILSLS